ncbi:MAG: CPBP family intramembrane glutamic endopeptidase [Candidatus Sumerlaeaceae bacterium]
MFGSLSEATSRFFQLFLFASVAAAFVETIFSFIVCSRAHPYWGPVFLRAGILSILLFLLIAGSGVLASAHRVLGESFVLTITFDFVFIFATLVPAAFLYAAARFPKDMLTRVVATGIHVRLWPGIAVLFELGSLFVLCAAASIVPLFIVDWHYGPQGQILQDLLEKHPLTVLWLVLRAPFPEELVFRGYLLPRLFLLLRRVLAETIAFPIAAVVTAAIFAAGHVQLMVPEWLKIAQAFLLGLVLAYVARRAGLLAAVGFHFVFNAFAFLLALLPINPRP